MNQNSIDFRMTIHMLDQVSLCEARFFCIRAALGHSHFVVNIAVVILIASLIRR